MYFLVVDAGDNKDRAAEFAKAHKGDMAPPSMLLFTPEMISRFGLDMDDIDVVSNWNGSLKRFMFVLHLSFGVAQKKQYDEIETSLRLMFGTHFLGRSRKRRDD